MRTPFGLNGTLSGWRLEMDKESRSVLTFEGYEVEEFLFRINPEYSRKTHGRTVAVRFDLKRFVVLKGNSAKASLECSVFPDPRPEEPFTVFARVSGSFRLPPSLPQDDTRRRIMVDNTCAILYPYLRAQITFGTSNTGHPPLVLPLINVTRVPAKVIEESSVEP